MREQCISKGELMTSGKFQKPYSSVTGFSQAKVSNCPGPLLISTGSTLASGLPE